MNIRPISKELQKKAEKELNEIPSQIEENVRYIQEWLSKQEHLISRKDDQLLLNFLRGSKYSLQRTKEKLDAFYTSRSLVTEIGQNWDPLLPEMQTLLSAGLFVPLPLPKNDPASIRSFLIHIRAYDPEVVTLTCMSKATCMMINVLINEDDNFAISGGNAICDFKGVHFKTMTQVTPTLLHQAIYSLDTSMPARIKSIHFINIPTLMQTILDMAKLLVSKKIAKRLHFHSSDGADWDAIYKDIPREILPEEYGGQAGKYQDLATQWKETIESHREGLLKETEYHSVESKRPGKQHTIESVFGIEGSFRKLEVD